MFIVNFCISSNLLCLGSPAVSILEQVRHVELWSAALGDLLLWAGALPPDPAWGGRQARGEGLPDGGPRGLPPAGLHHHEGGLGT